MSNENKKLSPLFKDAEILISIGSGGVGKTTFSAAVAVLAAKQGKKVLVLTIDPSKRLAQALGIEGQNEIVKVPHQNYKGELYAAIIDHKNVFEKFLLKAADKNINIDKILKNKLYIQLSTNLSGSQEFTSLEKLYSTYESKQFDLIVLDTPPAQHAKDFLNAPQKLSSLFNEGVASWFRNPEQKGKGIFVKLMNVGTQKIFKVLEFLTGSEFIHELSDFFQNIYLWQDKIETRINDVHKLLINPKTHFCLVTSFDEAKLQEAQKLAKEIRKNGYHLEHFIINRYFPNWIEQGDESFLQHSEIEKLYNLLDDYYKKREFQYNSFEKSIGAQESVLKLPEFYDQVQDLGTLEKVADWINSLSGSL